MTQPSEHDDPVPGVDVPGVDVPGVDVPGVDVPGVDVPGVDVSQSGPTITLIDALALIDQGLGGLTDRQLVSAAEVTDLLLDVRSLIAASV